MKQIDEKVNKVYEFACEYVKDNGFPPSVREICAKLGIKSTATAFSYLERLKKRGLIEKCPMKKRALSLVSDKQEFVEIPMLGVVTAGTPIFAVENLDGYYPLPPDFFGAEDMFALRIQGESMINAGIYDKDVVLVKKQNNASNGDIVVALIDDSATVKRFFSKNNKVILHPENETMEDIIPQQVEILGIVQGLVRKF